MNLPAIRAEADRIEQKYGQWGNVIAFPVQDWRYLVQNDETRLGYWEWVAVQAESQGVKIL